MSAALQVIQEKVQRLSPQKQAEVISFIDSMLQEEQTAATQAPATRGLTFDWCDGPDDPPVELTSVELQHEALEWRLKKAEEFLQKQ